MMWQWCENDVTMIAIVTMMPSATTQPEKKRKTALASVQGDQHHFFQIKYQLYLYHPYHILNCWLWLCNFQAQFWCWRSSRIDYYNYLTIWLSLLSDHVRFSDCHNYLMHSVRFTDWLKNSNLTRHYRNICFGCMVRCMARWNVDYSHLMQ